MTTPRGFSGWFGGLVGLVIFGMAGPANATLITFEGESGSTFVTGGFVDIGDFRFTLTEIPNGGLVITNQSNIVESGTTKLFAVNHSEITMTRIDGATFTLLGLDVGGSFDTSPNRWADTVDIIAGATHTADLTDLVAFYHPQVLPAAGFMDITSVLFRPFTTGGANDFEFTLDNINIAMVPEPSTLALFTIGLFGLGVMTRRRRVV